MNEKDKYSNLAKYNAYLHLHEQITLAIYISLSFLLKIRTKATIARKEIDKTCVNIFTLCFVILSYVYNNKKKTRLTKKFTITYKYTEKVNPNDLSNAPIYVLFNDYIKDKSKEVERGENNNLITLEQLNTLLEKNNYSENILNLINDFNWQDNFYIDNDDINPILSDRYFPLKEYKPIVEKRINSLTNLIMANAENDTKWEYSYNEILTLLPLYEKELVHYSINSLENNLKKKNLYKAIKKNAFSWRGYWSDRNSFYQENILKAGNINNNEFFANKNNVSKLKYKLINHYTKSFMKPILVPILDMNYYLPDFSEFDISKLFHKKEKSVVIMDIDKTIKMKEEQKKQECEETTTKENYLRKIYIKSNKILAEKLLKITESLDLGKEEEFSIFKEEENQKEKEKEKNKKSDENNEKNVEKEEKLQKKYYLSCLVKTSHHIKGVCFIDDKSLNFKVFMNQKTGNAMGGGEHRFHGPGRRL